MANIIREPGKFEGEHISVPYFWDFAMESGGQDVYGSDETLYSFFVIDSDDRAKFPDLTEYGICLYESDQGFVNAVWFDTQAEYEKAIADLEAESAESEEDEESDE